MNAELFRAEAAKQGYDRFSEVELAPGTVRETHAHEYAATLLVIDGDLSITHRGRTEVLEPGDRFSLPAGVPHAERVGSGGVRLLLGRAESYGARARYFDSSTAFNMRHPEVPCRQFTAERDRALAPDTGNAIIALDQGPEMGLDFPATTPLVLAYYLRMEPGASLPFESGASAELYFVIRGAGRSRKGDDLVSWRAGDAFALPGGATTEHRAAGEGAVLWAVGNAPLLALDGLAPPPPGRSFVETVHFPAADIAERMAAIRPALTGSRMPGIAVIFSSRAAERRRNISPGLTFAMNQLPATGIATSPSAQFGRRVAGRQRPRMPFGRRRCEHALGALGDHRHATGRRALPP